MISLIDEAQDILDRGLDLFINKFSGFNGQGLSNETHGFMILTKLYSKWKC